MHVLAPTNLCAMFPVYPLTLLAHVSTELFRLVTDRVIVEPAADDAADLCVDHLLGGVALAFNDLEHRVERTDVDEGLLLVQLLHLCVNIVVIITIAPPTGKHCQHGRYYYYCSTYRNCNA